MQLIHLALIPALSLQVNPDSATKGLSIDLFTDVQHCVDCGNQPRIISQQDVQVDFDGLKEWPDLLTIDNGLELNITVSKDYFLAKRGYIEDGAAPGCLDEDPDTLCPIIPDPNAPPDQFTYFWRGGDSQHDVYLTVKDGLLSGKIDGPNGRYVIRLTGAGYVLQLLRLSDFPPQDPDSDSSTAISFADKHLSDHKPRKPSRVTEKALKGVTNYIDILVLYTAGAVTQAGGLANLLDDIEAAENETNDALAASNVNYRVVFWGRLEEPSIQVITDQGSNSNNTNATIAALQQNATVQALRDSYGADGVHAIVGDDLFHCGVAVTQRQDCRCIGCAASNNFLPAGCSIGSAFEDFAYSIAKAECVIATDTTAHELGHNWGGEHHFNGLVPRHLASFPHSYGHVVDPFFYTIMAGSNGAPPVLIFSTPTAVDFSGHPFGVVDEADNARTFNDLGPIYAGFRDRPDAMFADSFE